MKTLPKYLVVVGVEGELPRVVGSGETPREASAELEAWVKEHPESRESIAVYGDLWSHLAGG